MSLREELADEQHEIWSHWMRYLFSVCEINGKGECIIPKDLVDRWQRQTNTSYPDLSVREQRSDLNQADKILKVLKEHE